MAVSMHPTFELEMPMRASLPFPGLRRFSLSFLVLSLAYVFAQSNNAQKTEPAKRLTRYVEQFPYKPWLEQDVADIITTEEKAAFKQLKNDQERDQFIEAFWARRDPTPDTFENEYEVEHYQRIIYANEHFPEGGSPGWKSDRGRIYILYGKPDEIESHPSGGIYERPLEEGGGTSTFPFEDWRYRYIEGKGRDVTLEFVDDCRCGKYAMALLPEQENLGLLYVPGKHQWNTQPVDPQPYLSIDIHPQAKFGSLEKLLDDEKKGIVSKPIDEPHAVPFRVHTNSVSVTDITSFASITVSANKRDFTPIDNQGHQQITMRVFGRISTLTGHVAEIFEGSVDTDLSGDGLQAPQNETIEFKTSLPLQRQRYRLEIAIQDADSNRASTYVRSFVVDKIDK